MKKMYLIFFLLLISKINAQNEPNDCINSIVVCGNSTLSDLEFSGIGNIAEATTNSCGSGENNSIWLKITPATPGTLGFIIEPVQDSGDTSTVDIDFFVFGGPSVSCNNLGSAIRCSTVNPDAIFQTDSLTGMNETSNDFSEGPGNLDENGNQTSAADGFVQWLTVNAGETYYILLDLPPISSSFDGTLDINWTGTATFSDTPTNQLPSGMSLNLEECDDDNDGLVTFDLTQNETQMVNGQDVTIAYFDDISNAQIDINSIAIPTSYNGTNNETVYVRLTDNITSCFSIFDINLSFFTFEINSPNALFECEPTLVSNFDFTNQSTLILGNNQNTNISYYTSFNNANLSFGAIGNSHVNTSNPQTIWYRLDNTDSSCFLIDSFTIEVIPDLFINPEPSFVFEETIIYCEDSYPDLLNLDIILNNNDINEYSFLWSTNQTSSSIPVNLSGDYVVEIENKLSGCTKTKTFHIIGSSVFSSTEPNFIDSEVYYCLDTFPDTIILDVGIENNDLTTFDYDWYFEGNLIAGDEDYTTLDFIPTMPINQIGNYTVNVSNSDGCLVTRTISVLPSEIATFENVLITDTKHRDRVSIIVEISGQGDYQYGIDLEPSDINNYESYQDENTFDNILYGTHIIYIRDKNGCGFIQKEVTFLEYSKFITPNNDGFYDTWNIDNINAISHNFNTISNIIIFDRLGKVMANINPKGLGWDGNYKGKPAPPSDYWFRLELVDFNGRAITKKGHFVLKRIK